MTFSLPTTSSSSQTRTWIRRARTADITVVSGEVTDLRQNIQGQKNKLKHFCTRRAESELTKVWTSRYWYSIEWMRHDINNARWHQYHQTGLLARSQYSEGPATGHLDTGFSWFPCVYKQMLRWFSKFQVATACFSCSPPDLNLLVTNFISCIHVK